MFKNYNKSGGKDNANAGTQQSSLIDPDSKQSEIQGIEGSAYAPKADKERPNDNLIIFTTKSTKIGLVSTEGDIMYRYLHRSS